MRERSCDVTSTAVPIVMCALSALLAIFSIPLNGAVLLAILRNKKFHTNFYLIIANTTVADLLIGTVLCPLSVAIHVREIRHEKVNYTVDTVFHFGLFTLAMVSVLSITVLSVDRMISLKFSSKYRVMKKQNFVIALIGVWLVAASLSPIYFFLDYSLFLTVISISAVLVTAGMMLITYMFYRAQLRRAFIRSHYNNANEQNVPSDVEDEMFDHQHHQHQSSRDHTDPCTIMEDEEEDQGVMMIQKVSDTSPSSRSTNNKDECGGGGCGVGGGRNDTLTRLQSIPMSVKRKFTNSKSLSSGSTCSKKQSVVSMASSSNHKLDEDYQVYLMEKRATNTFFYMMLVFFLCYVPIVAISLSIHISKGRHECFTVTFLEECIAMLCIVSSVCKTIVFLVRLTALRKACVNLLISEEEMERRWRKESVPMVAKKEEKKKLLSASWKDRLVFKRNTSNTRGGGGEKQSSKGLEEEQEPLEMPV